MIIQGRIWVFGDDVNTDIIFPGKYTYTIKDPKEMALHAMEDADPEFAQKVRKGDVIVAGTNFGCGSSRQQAVTALQYAGIDAIVAASFARIYYRNVINSGLLAIIDNRIKGLVENGDPIYIDTDSGIIAVAGEEFHYPPFPAYISKIIDAGGLLPYIKKQLELESEV